MAPRNRNESCDHRKGQEDTIFLAWSYYVAVAGIELYVDQVSLRFIEISIAASRV